MEDNAELQARLEALDHELADGDITRKGYEKRRTFLISEYLGTPLGGRVSEGTSQSQSPGYHQRQPSNPIASAFDGNDRAEYSPQGERPSSSQYGKLGVRNVSQPRSSSRQESLRPPASDSTGSHDSRSHTLSRADFAFNPADLPDQSGQGPGVQNMVGGDSRVSTMLDDQQAYFSDFAGQQASDRQQQQLQLQQQESYGGPQRYSMSETFSPNVPAMLPANELPHATMIDHQMPLEPRDVPFGITDPHNKNIPMSQFESMGAVLRHRGKTNAKQPAYWVLDSKGKETASITWEKLASKAEKVAQIIRDKSSLHRGARVALIYRDTEIIEFATALMGCFLAGVVAVPINTVEDYQKLSMLLSTTQAHLALTTENNLKAFQRDIAAHKWKWPAGVEWWKTTEFGSWHPRKNQEPPTLQVPDLAYIEFSHAPTGDIRGVVLSHRTIMHQMACISAMLSTIPDQPKTDTFSDSLRDRNGAYIVPRMHRGETILSYLDPREGVGLILGVLLGVYGGHTTVWIEPKTVDTAGLYAHLLTRYRTTVMVADYSRLKFAAYNYQQDPMTTRTFKKGAEPNFSSVKICLIDTLTVDSEFHEVLADRWFKPLYNTRAREVVAPMLCLPEHGGMIISVRDWLGGEERMGCPLSEETSEPEETNNEGERSPNEGSAFNGFNTVSSTPAVTKKSPPKNLRTELSEVLLDKEALKTNEVVVLAKGDEARRRANEPGTIRVGSFGYPIPDATLAIVDPETSLLSPSYTVGEVWVDSPSLSGGFWSLPKHTETIFHARPYRFVEGSPTPVLVDLEFLRTGLLGCVIEGKVYILGLYEDRIRQKVQWVEDGAQDTEHRYFFVQHLVSSVVRNTPKIHDCSAFDVFVNGEYLPIILIETLAASTAPVVPGGPPRQLDLALLDSLSERCMDILYQEHHLRVYCVMITAPNTLPKILKNGRKDIGNMLCRRDFGNGSLPCVHVQFGVERAVQNLPLGDDPAGGIWSPVATSVRENILMMNEKQYSGVDHREVVMDERTATPLNQFSNIEDLLQWRVSRQPDELAYCTVDGRGKEGKGVNWKKFDLKVAAIAMYLRTKVKVQPGDHLLLMYTHSEEFVYAIHACFVIGAVAIPMAPLDQNRLNEDSPAMLSMIADFKVKAILVNNEVHALLREKSVAQHLKQAAMILRVNQPNIYNTTKPSKQSHGCRELGFTIRPPWVQPGYPVLIWVYWTPDQRRIAVQLSHRTIMALCKVQKETCQMTSSRPILACVRSTVGLGFIHMCVIGIYLAAPTYLVSPVDFAQNPASLFLSLSRYKVKDTYATSQMLDHAMTNMAGKGFALYELKNLMISTDSRPRVDIYQRVRVHFAQAGLDRTAINTIYSHVMNPMIASRSYMCVEPVELWLDSQALRRGLVVPVDPELEPHALMVQDSGMVPVSTQISIVNPETNCLCYVGEYGEIWVQSEACAHAFYMSENPLDEERFNARREDGDPNVRYVRTGDLGFLHNVSRPIGPGGALVEMQVLFVLGAVGETFEVNGLSHFPMDIESSVEKCHRNIVPRGCAVFHAGGLVVILVEVVRKNFLASLVPVIVNAALNTHQLVPDIVAFVARGDFPRSRLGEKQRGKILASWVTRKIRTIAQFGIRDPDGAESQTTETGMRNSSASFRNGSIVASSTNFQYMEGTSTVEEPGEEEDFVSELPDNNVAELPAPYGEFTEEDDGVETQASRSDHTPTGPSGGHDTYGSSATQRADFGDHAKELYTSDLSEQDRAIQEEVKTQLFLTTSIDQDDFMSAGGSFVQGGTQGGDQRNFAQRWSDDEHGWSQDALLHMSYVEGQGQKWDEPQQTRRL